MVVAVSTRRGGTKVRVGFRMAGAGALNANRVEAEDALATEQGY